MARSKDEMSIEELKLFEAKEARAHALKAIRHAKNQLGKALFALSQMETDFQKTRIPIRRVAILNEAIDYLEKEVMPSLKIAEMASAQSRLAVRDQIER
jgi:hypothetical protein